VHCDADLELTPSGAARERSLHVLADTQLHVPGFKDLEREGGDG
jgi:hypothetical protein